MTAKRLLFDKEARQKLTTGAGILAKAVVSTLGPRSRNVAINREYPAPIVLHDGVSVAENIRLKDPFEDMGAVLLREAASKTNINAGDGTTTATLLANTLIQEGMKIMGGVGDNGFIIGGVNAMVLRDDLLKWSARIEKKVVERAQKIKDKKQHLQIATISSASEELGQLVVDAVEKVSKDGIVMIEEAAGFESSLEMKEGMQFDNGYLSPYFVTDSDRMVTEYKDAFVLITNQRISNALELTPIIEKVAAEKKPLLIIADDVNGPALMALVKTKLAGLLQNVAVAAPEFADRRKEVLQDIALLTGGNLIDGDLGQKIEDAQISDLGRLKSLRVTSGETTLVPDNPDKEEITERVAAIKDQLKEETNQFKRNKLEQRLAKLVSGVAVIYVGGASQSEIEEKKERAIDAVHALKAALAEGVLPGAGSTLYGIATEFEAESTAQEKETAAYGLIQKMLRAPFEQILKNAGEDISKVQLLIDVLPDEVKNRGYDIVGKKAGDLLQLGVIDPAKVTRLAVSHGISVAATLLTTDTLITEEEDNSVQKMRVVQ